MKIESIPGLTIHQHEGRFTGTVDMPPADLAAVSWNGRVMLVVMADVGGPMRITTDKEDTNKAHWTYSVVDAAIVRDESMRDHLERALHIDAGGVEPHALEMETGPSYDQHSLHLVGMYDKEGTFLGMASPEDITPISPTTTVSPERFETFLEALPKAEAVVPVREALGEDVLDEEYEGDVPTARIVEEKKPMFSTPAVRAAARTAATGDGPEVVEVLTKPIRHKDARLQAFLDDDRDGR
jgi:hypothetical protein